VNIPKLAQELTNLADVIYAISEALTEQPAVSGTGAGVAVGAASPPGAAPAGLPDIPPLDEELYADELDEQEPQGALAVCPKHRKPYREGRYGPYCSQKSDDPAWSKNGFCRITPKNAAVWLRAQAAVTA